MFKPEILAPGGGFNSSIHAFEAGADAVYIGMSAFSARKSAANFTVGQLRRLKSYAVENDKKIFAAINTVIRQDELKEVIPLLHQLNLAEVDGIILQDMGLARIISKYFPDLEMHASTQLAVHNAQGVRALKNEGFRRVILARELTLKEIETIRHAHSDVELEVFIHGAMCYSFSGICLASGWLLGRSGNRGECGQICRTWFDGRERHRYAFSANDMKAGEIALELQKMGIDSLKIEGRLKSPEYVSHTVKYYRALIDGDKPERIEREADLSAVSFSRDQTSAFFPDSRGKEMINNKYASHTGILAGEILSSAKGQIRFKTETGLSDRDGLLLFLKEEPFQFALRSPGKAKSYRKGDTVTALFEKAVPSGTQLFKVSGHNLQLKEFKEESRKPWKTPLDIRVILKSEELLICAETPLGEISLKENIIPEASQKADRQFSQIMTETLNKSGDHFYCSGQIRVANETELNSNRIFIPLSRLKKTRQKFFSLVEETLEKRIAESTDSIVRETDMQLNAMDYCAWEGSIPERSEMVPGSLIPFGTGISPFLPLPPLQFSDNDFCRLENEINGLLDGGEERVVLGINNIGHLHFLEKYRDDERVLFFTDYCTYAANRSTALFYREKTDRLLFSYYWVEDRQGTLEPMRKVDRAFEPHLFVSRICYRLHNKIGSCGDCRKNYSYKLAQRDRNYIVVVRDCLTWLFQKV